MVDTGRWMLDKNVERLGAALGDLVMTYFYRCSLWAVRAWLAATVLVAFAAAVTPSIDAARLEARRNMCVNHLWQHSGSHEADLVYVDRDTRILSVSSCPSCSRPEVGMQFIVEGREDESLTQLMVPEATVLEATFDLRLYKADPEYKLIRASFSRYSAQAIESVDRL